MQNRTRRNSLRRIFLAALLLVYATSGLVLAILIPRQLRGGKEQWYGGMTAMASLQAQLIEESISRHLGEVSVLCNVRSVMQVASRDPQATNWTGPGPSPMERLIPLLNSTCTEFGLSGITVTDKDALPVLTLGAEPVTVPGLADHVASALSSRTAVFVDVFDDHGRQSVAYVAPVYLDNSVPAGALIATENPTLALFPLARLHVVVGKTIQSTIERKVQKDGQTYVEILWDYHNPPAASARTVYDQAAQVDRVAVDGGSWSGTFTSTDGIAHIGASAPVPSAGWGVVVNIDSSEALARERMTIWLEVILTTVAVPIILPAILLQTERSKRLATEEGARRLAQTNAEVERLNRIIRATRDINQLISHKMDIQEVLDRTCRNVLDVGDFQTSWIALCDGDKISVAARAGMTEIVPKTVIAISALERGRPCVYQALKTGKPVFVTTADRRMCTECVHYSECPSSEVFVGPLLAQGDVLGVLVLHSLNVRTIGSNEQDALIELAGDVAFAVASERVREQKEQAETALHQAEKMETVGQLAGGVAHDFNNLLTGIIGNVDLALENADDFPAIAQPLRDVSVAARRAAELTAKLLAFSRKAIINPSVIDMDHVIEEALALLSRSLPATISIRHVQHEEIWPVIVDAVQMTQVLLNLAINARDAMHGAGTLTIEAANRKIDADYVTEHPYAWPGDFVTILVKDTGEGMTDEVKAHIFEPFFTTKPTGKGTGLGLSMVFGAVKQAGGWIDIQSAPGTGTAVTVFLPRSHRVIASQDIETSNRPTDQGGTETVLVIDDDDVVRRLAKRVLERAGYTVVLANDGDEGLRKFREQTDGIDVVLSDLTMPGMTGAECLTQMLDARPDLPVVLSSGYSSDLAYQEFVQRPHTLLAFLGKPYKPEELLATIRHILDDAAASDTDN